MSIVASLAAFWLCGTAHAELRFDRTTTDLGKIRGGPYLTYTLPFTNVGQQTIQIVEARASCSCMQPQIYPLALRPGERGAMAITLNTVGIAAGQHTWVTRISYRDGSTPAETSVSIVANYTPEVSVTPPSVVLYTDDSLNHELTLTDVRPKTLKILGVESSSPHLQAGVLRQQRNYRGHWVGTIFVQTNPSMPPGRIEETLAIYTDDPQYRQLQVHVTVVKKAGQQVTVHPSRLTLRTSRLQPTASQLLRVHSTGEAVSIRRISADVPGVTGRWAAGPGADATVRIEADRNQIGREAQGTISIELDRPTQETLSVPFTVE